MSNPPCGCSEVERQHRQSVAGGIERGELLPVHHGSAGRSFERVEQDDIAALGLAKVSETVAKDRGDDIGERFSAETGDVLRRTLTAVILPGVLRIEVRPRDIIDMTAPGQN